MSKLSPKFLMIIAVVLSLLTSGLIYNYLQKNAQTQVSLGEPVVVAALDIPGRTVISAEMVKVVNVPAELVQQGVVRDMGKAIGVMSRVPISAGDQLTERRLTLGGKVSGFVGNIPRDKRAFTIAASDITGIAGFLKAGDYVDIIATFEAGAGQSRSKLLLENVLVLASNRDDNMENDAKTKKDGDKMISVTLAVSSSDASMLALAEQKGKMHLALRPFQASSDTASVRTVTTEDLVGSYQQVEKRQVENRQVENQQSRPEVTTRVPVSGGVQVIRGTKVETVTVN